MCTNDLDRFADRRPGRDDVVDDQDLTLERRPDHIAAFAMVLHFLPVVTEWQIVTFFGKRDARGSRQGDALIGGSEQLIARKTGSENGLRVKHAKLAQARAVAE